MKDLCIFVTYSENNKTSKNVIDIITEICNSFSEVIIASNYKLDETDLSIFDNYKVLIHKNEGYDFGMIYKTLKTIDIESYDRIAFLNDSVYMIRPFRDFFSRKMDADMWGMTDSYQFIKIRDIKYYFNKVYRILFSKNKNTPPKDDIEVIKKRYHLQSYFLIFEKKAISLIKPFFDSINFEDLFKIKKHNILKKNIIIKCEIGISRYMIEKGMKIESIFNVDKINGISYTGKNQTISLWRELLKEGFPFIKKSIINKIGVKL